jgi:hypothetical protein
VTHRDVFFHYPSPRARARVIIAKTRHHASRVTAYSRLSIAYDASFKQGDESLSAKFTRVSEAVRNSAQSTVIVEMAKPVRLCCMRFLSNTKPECS